MSIVLGLTGSFGSGKSTVASMFEELGVAIKDADQASREVVEPGSEGFAQIVAEFGPDTVGPDGTLDRKKLADIVFNDREARLKLNGIVHPKVGEVIARFLNEHKADSVVVLEIPLLLESSRRGNVDKVVVVRVDERNRFGRLHRAGFSEKEVIARLGSQMSQSRKVKLADHVIDNNADPEETRRQVLEIARHYGLQN